VDLAMNIALRNKNIGEEELNFIVQNTIDRIIFLRIAEDRSVEPYGDLKTDIIKGNFYNNLIYRFNRANQKYNSGLFDFEKDNISTKIIIDNKIIKEIISELYYPICPYEFSVLPVEILGSAYEQFLGKKISLTKTGRARIQEKPEVRKAGGVYYTPQYIVDYIVENTIGKIIQGKTPKDVTDIKICDPACGSGSFLIGAYQFLLDWHKDYYSNKGKISKGEKNNPLTPLGELTTAEKKRILLNNIYGVDLDNNAVEVTKLSLLLKCMEGETKATIETELKLFQDRVLPTLDNNIKCGNSLIDLDYYENELDFGEERKIKPFSWEKSFPEVFNRKILKEKKEDLESLIKKTKHHAQKALDYATEMEEKINKVSESEPNYELNGGFDVIIGNPPYVQTSVIDKASHKYLSKKFKANNDLYSMFIEQSLKLLKQENDLGFILPSLFLKGVRYQSLRNIVNIHSKNVIIKEQGDKVFKNVKMPTCIILIKKGKNNRKKDFFINENFKYFNKIKTIPLGTISETKRGLEIGRNKLNDIGNIKCLVGGNIDVYTTKDGKFIDEKTYKVFSKKDEIFKSPKIIVRETGNKFFANIDYDHLITTRSIYNTRIINKNYSAELILAIINSSLFKFYFKQFISPETNIFPKIRIAQLKELPIPQQVNKTKNQEIEKLVSQIIQLNKDKKDLNLPNQIELTENRIKYIEEKINKIIFELYGLNEEEIEIIKN
ncbi:MAG: N-6 DNA methylase, partial [Bacteroidales bacterium]|nr:N-6 DNA methylase [Bacteroidales bacterium]